LLANPQIRILAESESIMATTLTSIRKTSLMPILAMVSSFLLVAGQVFNCCRLNESISERIGKAALAVSQLVSKPDVERVNPFAKTHLGCHGHPPSDETRVKSDLPDASGVRLKGEEPCLSESGFAKKAFTPTDASHAIPFSETPALVRETLVPRLPRFEKPRPQNKSSPPVYLLTLRILV
jgi:hypothetical protein